MRLFRKCTCEWWLLWDDERNQCWRHRPMYLDLRKARLLGIA